MYWNMAITEAKIRHPYSDTPTPKRFEAVSPLDPEFFSRINDFAEALLGEKADARYSPLWVAAELENDANAAAEALRKARAKATQPGASFRRMAADVEIQCGLGIFFAEKFRAGVLFAIYERTNFRPALEEALKAYRKSRDAWAAFAEGAKPVYRADVTFGPEYFQRGHGRTVYRPWMRTSGRWKTSSLRGKSTRKVRKQPPQRGRLLRCCKNRQTFTPNLRVFMFR
jgi:hypothetical protein